MPLSAGEKLGPYEILAPIGAGGMGEVYRARDTRLSREIAIKVLPGHLTKDPQSLAAFRREALAVAALAHPNILVLHDVGSEQEVQYLVTELLDGETLRERLSRGALPWRRVVQLGAAMARGLAAAHSKEIVHRDIKPGNIFLTSDGQVKILDFGLAQTKAVSTRNDETVTRLEANQDGVAGTIGYMSPEQVRGEKLEASSDIFSLGCVLYEMVTGRRAFPGKSATDIMAATLKDEPAPFDQSGDASPADLHRVIERCLAKNPAQRFHSAHDLAFALEGLQGSVSERQSAATAPRTTGHRRILPVTLALLLILTGAALYFWQSRAARKIDSIAVLPFVNAGGGEDAEYLSDGLTESLIDSLFQVPSLKVMSRNAVFRYKGKETDAREAARQLGVSAVLTGRIVERKGQLSVSAELVDARDGSELWAEKYERPTSDILAVEQDITSNMSEKLRLRLTGEEKQKLAKPGTENPEAYRLYLQGRYFAGKFTKDGFDKGLGYMRQAVAADPNYARAYEGISYAYQIADDALIPPAEAGPKSKEAALKAIALDDSLSEGHADLAGMYFWYDYDWPGARREFQRAIQLNPKSSFAHEFYGWTLTTLGDANGGIAEGRKALEIDPLSIEAGLVMAQDLYVLKRYDEAMDVLRKGMDQDPDYPPNYWVQGMVYLAQGKAREAIATLEKGRQIGPMDWTTELLVAAYATTGNRPAAQKILNELDERAKRGGYVSQYYLAYAYLALNDRERALAALEKDYENRSPNMTYIKLDPGLTPLHNEPRYHALLQKMKLE